MKVRGKKIGCMVTGYSNGPMAENILVNISMIKKKGKGCLYGQMGRNILANGLLVNSMEKVYIFVRMETENMVNEKME